MSSSAAYSNFENLTLSGRILSANDAEAVLELNRAHHRVMRKEKPPDYDARFERALFSSYLNADNKSYVMFGGFLNDRLAVCLSIFFWNSFPHYTIGSLKTDGRLNLFTTQPTPFSSCVLSMLRYAEAQGYYRYYYIRAAQGWPVERIMSRIEHSIPEVRRYHREAELFVPRRTMPSFPFVRQMMADRVWPQDLVVESMTLMQRYRPRLGFRCVPKSEPLEQSEDVV